MESLVEKWKITQNNKNFSNTLRESQAILKNSLQFSNEKPPKKPISINNSGKKPLNKHDFSSSSSSSEDISIDLFKNSSNKKKPVLKEDLRKKNEKIKENLKISKENFENNSYSKIQNKYNIKKKFLIIKNFKIFLKKKTNNKNVHSQEFIKKVLKK